MPPPSYFPLRWESTGDQWWYASPIDFAAANGHYDLVRELLHLDSNLLIKLTSLRRIRRLETVWDDGEQFNDVAKCRSQVARQLFLECETQQGTNSLIRAGYGGWLLYTAASAGDMDFVKELLERDPLLVFGEGEYGVTDIFYAAARSHNSDVFKILFDFSMCGVSSSEEEEEGGQMSTRNSDFRWEMMNRAVHAAARGGNLEILKEFLKDCSDALVYRDAQGSTILHSSSGKGQVEVVKYVISSFDIITSKDYQGNTALHVAAYKGCLDAIHLLMSAHPPLASIANNYGDTFLHMAVSGFRTPGFRRVDRQIELVKYIISSQITNIQEVINTSNHDGRTALHLAVIGNIQSNVVELLMTAPSINLNIRDNDDMTPLDLLKQRPQSSSSFELLIKQLISAGGISNAQDNAARSAIASHLRGQGAGTSPGTSFRIPDAEIFLHTSTENAIDCEIRSVGHTTCSSNASEFDSADTLHNNKKSSSVNYAARKLKSLLQWTRKKERKDASSEIEDDHSLNSLNLCRGVDNNYPIPLRQKHSKLFCLSSNKRTLSQRSSSLLPSRSARRKFTAGLRHGVIQPTPQFSVPPQSSRRKFTAELRHGVIMQPQSPPPSSSRSGSHMSSPAASLDNGKHVEAAAPPFQPRQSFKHKQASFNKRMMNQYFCLDTKGLNVAEPQPSERYKHETSIMV